MHIRSSYNGRVWLIVATPWPSGTLALNDTDTLEDIYLGALILKRTLDVVLWNGSRSSLSGISMPAIAFVKPGFIQSRGIIIAT